MLWLGNQCQLSTHTFPYVFPVRSCSSETDCKSHWLWWPAFPVCLKYFYKHRCFGLIRESISWYLHKVEPFPHCATGLIFEDAFTSLLCGTWCVRYMRERRGDRPGYYNFVTTVSAPPGEKMQLKRFCIFSLWLHLEKRELFCLLLFGLMFSPCILSCALPRKEHNQH